MPRRSAAWRWKRSAAAPTPSTRSRSLTAFSIRHAQQGYFTIEDRDRAAGLFYLRYADPEKAGQEEPNFFQRLFGAKGTTPVRYRVSVKAEGDKSTVRILDDRGQAITDDNAKRILSLLMDDLK